MPPSCANLKSHTPSCPSEDPVINNCFLIISSNNTWDAMRRWCTSPQNNRNHRWGRHLVSSCQHLYEPSILCPACNCSCAWLFTLLASSLFPLSTKMVAAQDNVIVIMNDGHYQSEMTKAGAKLVVVDFTASWWVTVVKLIDQINMHFRIAWSLQLLFIEHHCDHKFFFFILTKFGHSLHGETFLGVDEVFFFQLV